MTLENILLYILKWANYGWFLLRKHFTWIHAADSEVGTGIFFETLPSYFLIISYSRFLIVIICQQTDIHIHLSII